LSVIRAVALQTSFDHAMPDINPAMKDPVLPVLLYRADNANLGFMQDSILSN
jgi:hypothetical protein